MSSRAQPLVRPIFLKWTLTVLILLVPFVSHAACDYAESKRLERLVQQIRDAHEPTTVWEATAVHYVSGDAARSARYYRTAAALGAADSSPRGPVWSTDDDAALDYLVRAAELPFDGFGSPQSALAGALMQVARVASARMRSLADRGDAAGAGALLYAHARLERVMESGWIGWPMLYQLSEDVAYVLSRVPLDQRTLERLAEAFADMDRDETQKQFLLRQRAFLLETMRQDRSASWLTRPVVLRALNDRLEQTRALIDRASRPWPRRLDLPSPLVYRTSMFAAWALGQQASIVSMRDVDESQFHAFATSAARMRAVRLAIAAERYRRTHHAWPSTTDALVPDFLKGVPVDPFSGAPMKTVTESDGGFIAYSVGLNNRDEHGQLQQNGGAIRPGISPAMAVGDIGTRISPR